MRTFAVVALLALSACGREPTAVAPSGILLVDQESYVAVPTHAFFSERAFTVITRYVNNSALPIWISAVGNKPSPDAWVQPIDSDGAPVGGMNGVPCACAESPGIILQPGDIRTDTLTLPFDPDYTKYRVYFTQVELCTSAPAPLGCGPELPESQRVSLVFDVTSLPAPFGSRRSAAATTPPASRSWDPRGSRAALEAATRRASR